MSFLTQRPRRLRQSAAWRGMVAETTLSARDFVYPLFVVDGQNVVKPIATMPGHRQLSIDTLVEESRRAHALGVPAVILFGIPDHKDAVGSPGYDPRRHRPARHPGAEARAPRAARLDRRLPLRVHQPRPLRRADRRTGDVDNDATLPLLAQREPSLRPGRRRRRSPRRT